MKRYMLAFAALVTLTAGTAVTANALDVGIGPNGVYVGPNRHHNEYYNVSRDCRVIMDRRTNRFGEDVEVRRLRLIANVKEIRRRGPLGPLQQMLLD